MERIGIHVSRPYEVLAGGGLIGKIGEYAVPVCRTKRIAVITDDVVDSLYGGPAVRSLEDAGFETTKFVFPNGEGSKNIGTYADILEHLAANGLRRNDMLLALGGGVVGDITGFAAATYMRGTGVIQVPTTLLSMVDSSVGGKTAIDLKNGKNLAGAFLQPSLVLCDTDIAETLPDGIFAEGMAEVIKCGVIRDLPVLGYIRSGELKRHLPEVIVSCIGLKRDIVERDEFDSTGVRNILNVGHTAAHAIEKLSGYTVSHGRAVAAGLVLEARIAEALGLCGADTVGAISEAVGAFGPVCAVPWSAEQLAGAMKSDKKNRDAGIVFELPCRIGLCKEVTLGADRLTGLLDGLRSIV